MSPAPPPDTPEAWDAASRGYAEQVAPRLMRSFAEAHIERMSVDANSEVLEVGASSGALPEALGPRVGSVLATDFSPRMIEVLAERLEEAGVTNVRCERMDGQDLSLDDDTFDAAGASFALMLFRDRAKGFAELNRVVRPGGRVVVSGWAEPDRFEAFGLFLTALQSAIPDLPPPPSPLPVFSLADPSDFEAQMEAGGFREVEVDFVARDLEVADFDQTWRMLTAGAPPVQKLFDQIGPEGAERVKGELSGLVRERFGEGPIRTTNVATIGAGVAS